jgi:hypothetical protein
MARAKRETTKYPGVYKRTIYAKGGKGTTVYDLKIRNEWAQNTSSATPWTPHSRRPRPLTQ